KILISTSDNIPIVMYDYTNHILINVFPEITNIVDVININLIIFLCSDTELYKNADLIHKISNPKHFQSSNNNYFLLCNSSIIDIINNIVIFETAQYEIVAFNYEKQLVYMKDNN